MPVWCRSDPPTLAAAWAFAGAAAASAVQAVTRASVSMARSRGRVIVMASFVTPPGAASDLYPRPDDGKPSETRRRSDAAVTIMVDVNPKGNLQTLIASHPANSHAAHHGAFSRDGQILEPRTRDVAEALLEIGRLRQKSISNRSRPTRAQRVVLRR